MEKIPKMDLRIGMYIPVYVCTGTFYISMCPYFKIYVYLHTCMHGDTFTYKTLQPSD